MTLRLNFSSLFLLLFLFSCGSEAAESDVEPIEDPIDALMQQVFNAHGELGDYSFDFRDNGYSFSFIEDQYRYTKTAVTDSTTTADVLTNDFFERTLNGEILNLTPSDADRYSESLNSVVYFACLPLNLVAPAVNKSQKPAITINGQSYEVIEVTFDAEGGGTDHEDVFYYWFNQETHIMDFMAYSYNVNGGGVRFRSAYNSRMVGNMRFQDYVNYGAPVGTDMGSLPVLFEQGELEELSVIETKNVRSL